LIRSGAPKERLPGLARRPRDRAAQARPKRNAASHTSRSAGLTPAPALRRLHERKTKFGAFWGFIAFMLFMQIYLMQIDYQLNVKDAYDIEQGPPRAPRVPRGREPAGAHTHG
jgi:hypothetical protein